MHAKQIVAFDYVRIALFDERGESLERVSLRFFNVVWIDDDQFFPAAVVRERDAHDMIVSVGIGDRGAGVTDSGYSIERKHFKLQALQFFKGQILEQRVARSGEVMLHRIGKREEIATGIFQSIPQRDQFLPAIDSD